jgi:capreomycidine synthase
MIDSPALLENWMREYYFETDIDIGSSGVQSYGLSELRELLDITQAEMDRIVFDDSWTMGGPSLRKAIAARWAGGQTEFVMATHGSSEAIYLVMNALLKAGDEVVVLEPIYQQYHSIAESIGCSLKPWQLQAGAQFRPDLEEAKKLVNNRTRMVVVNFPHNPTGTSLTLTQQEELIKAVAKVGAYLVWDNAFAELVYEGQPLPDPRLYYDRTISLGTLSKAYGLPGLRVGWCLAASDVLARLVQLRDYITLHLSPLVEFIAQRAIEKAGLLLDIRRRQAQVNLNILEEWARLREDVEWSSPMGGVCAFLRLHGISNTETFCHNLAQIDKVLLVPGTCFNHPQHVRLGFGGRTSDLEEGLVRLGKRLSISTPTRLMQVSA